MSIQGGSSTNNKGLLSSLKVRLILSALLVILVLMPLIGLTLNDAFKQQAKSATRNELSAYVSAVLAVTEVEDKQLVMPEQLLNNQFNVIQSGLYALISTPSLQKQNNDLLLSGTQDTISSHSPNILWQSNSFLGLEAPDNLPYPVTGQSAFSEITLEGKAYLIYSFSALFEHQSSAKQTGQFPLTIHIIKDQADFKLQVKQFTKQLWTWLLILMVLLIIVQAAWLSWTIKPLAQFTHELREVEQGHANQLKTIYPTELQAVARQLNALLNTEQNQRKRYRNALSDLAHSLKTPLAVIQSQKGLSRSAVEQVDVINKMIEHQLKRAQSAAGSSWHLGIKVSSVSDKLIRTLAKIYQEPQILINQHVDPQAIFKGDQSDLTEILGNVLDNACKAAKSQVLLTVTTTENLLTITVEDDGKGVTTEQRTQIFERGIRADSYQHGHGIGLAIVRDLIDSYNGQLSVSTSERLGGAKFLFSFSLGAG
ncbi:ATP-binding protein [Psychromonas sp.]|uniref:ATP-binding protein n=1 Tax=Psychromonas sp. TaxID=1884585 RepID=UPI00356AA4C3